VCEPPGLDQRASALRQCHATQGTWAAYRRRETGHVGRQHPRAGGGGAGSPASTRSYRLAAGRQRARDGGRGVPGSVGRRHPDSEPGRAARADGGGTGGREAEPQRHRAGEIRRRGRRADHARPEQQPCGERARLVAGDANRETRPPGKRRGLRRRRDLHEREGRCGRVGRRGTESGEPVEGDTAADPADERRGAVRQVDPVELRAALTGDAQRLMCSPRDDVGKVWASGHDLIRQNVTSGSGPRKPNHTSIQSGP